MLTIYFDGDCPICSREIAFYRKHSDTDANWIDITSLPSDFSVDGKTPRDLLSVMHVREANGTWHQALDAFSNLWSLVPFLRPLRFIFHVPVFKQLMQLGYKGFLAYRARKQCEDGCSLPNQPSSN